MARTSFFCGLDNEPTPMMEMIARKGIQQCWFARQTESRDQRSSGQERMECPCHWLIGDDNDVGVDVNDKYNNMC